MNAENGKTGIRRYIPILAWLPQYQRKWLRPDFIAGLTIMALLVPEGMAYPKPYTQVCKPMVTPVILGESI
jgi:MFS superfamily sulfate permease-like transporter